MNDFTVLVLEGAFASSVAATVNILSAARKLAPRLGVPVPSWRMSSVRGGTLALQDGMSVDTERLDDQNGEDGSLWIVPGLGLDSPKAIHQFFAQADTKRAVDAIRLHASAGGGVAASCSGVFVLQAAGLLSGKRATTAWWLAKELQRLVPDCRVDADRMVCADGLVLTAGAAFAQTDLMLHLLRALSGNSLADAVSRALLIDGRQAQASYIVPEVYANGDDLIGRLVARVESALPDPPSVGELAREFCMSERTLARYVKRATGRSPMALLQSVRQRRARTLLESSRMTVEQVASAVGYQDATALRRLMVRVAGASPSRFRPGSTVAIP
ncbi:GlxA family transcriptional regulator [Hydrogenophaga sp. RWCD_12]|uniref:GlxA family transcriptional regulator n=1 Tax=Hydrogenophaga sp. RWCD_12 TaxID=3391190 RepID=UPI0039850255